jgi:thiol-disulfide isomerase/thioredoxin
MTKQRLSTNDQRAETVRRLGGVVLVLGCLALAGCAVFGRKTPAGAAKADRPLQDLNLAATEGAAPGGAAPVPAPSTGILAGQVVDAYNRHPQAVFIQVSASQDSGEPKAAPIEVAADAQGYFLIQGLQPGRHYQLVARTREGEQLLAGTTWATPPNPRVVIRISQELASNTTPALPSAPLMPPSASPAEAPPAWPPGALRRAPRRDQAWAPGQTAPSGQGQPPPASGSPNTTDTNGANPTPLVPIDRSRIAGPSVAQNDSPRVDLPRPAAPGEPAPTIPFCSLTGRQLDNFALYDLNGQPWEWRQRNNRLTLIDFWGTWCIPCQQTIPHLNILQERYGDKGLEVVGIAYEQGLPQYHADQVRRVAQRTKINYTLLLGGDRLTCPVRTQFRVSVWPTLFLLDQNGRIIWQETGLDRNKVTELELLIRSQLNQR